jgi:hypothetical protein
MTATRRKNSRPLESLVKSAEGFDSARTYGILPERFATLRESLGNFGDRYQRLAVIELFVFPPERFSTTSRAIRERLRPAASGPPEGRFDRAGMRHDGLR